MKDLYQSVEVFFYWKRSGVRGMLQQVVESHVNGFEHQNGERGMIIGMVFIAGVWMGLDDFNCAGRDSRCR
ncbi:hypothetical protein HF072_04645 [Bacillus sp. RO3]|nr:hypothetical protein [Bacillus sp. RO3]